jgi:multimeric flavodoxin WrbA
MKICVLNCSPQNDLSITLQTVFYLQKWFQEKLGEDEFDIIPAFSGIVTDNIKEAIQKADLIIMSGAVFHFDVHSSMGELLDILCDNYYDILKDKPVTFLSTSGMLGDTMAHNRFEMWARRNDLMYINSLSLESSEILSPTGREELFCWFKYTKAITEYYKNKKMPKAKSHGRVVLLDTCEKENTKILSEIRSAKQRFEASGFETKIITLREKNIRHCTGCQCCFSNRTCVFNDDWKKTFEELYLDTDMIVYFGGLHYASLGNCYKTFLERHACLGRSGIEDEVIKSYFFILDEKSDREDISAFKINCETFDGLNCSYLSDICEIGNNEKMQELYDKMTIAYNSDIMPQNGFLKNGIRTGFARVAATVKNRCPGDYSYFKNLGCYDTIQASPHVQWLDNAEDAQKDREARLIPYKMTLLHLAELPMITERRKYKSISVIERQKAAARGTDIYNH